MHMIEVELPFLYFLRGQPKPADFTIVPIIVGRMDPPQINKLASILASCADDRTLFVFSADLSHFYPDARARQLDQFSIQSIMSQDKDSLARAVTDGNQILLTLLELAENQDWEPDFLVYRNSGEVSGDRDRVVGYASIVFGEPPAFTEEERRVLLRYARQVVEQYVQQGTKADLEVDLLLRHPIFRLPRGVFVTLNKDNQLRGCIGDLFSNAPLHEGIQKCAINAAVKDPRFDPVTAEELSQLVFSLSILNFPRKLEVDQPGDYLTALRPGKDGVILMCKGRQSTFLPSVWREIPDPREFLARLCLKQGASVDAWREPGTVLFRYGSCEFGEPDARVH